MSFFDVLRQGANRDVARVATMHSSVGKDRK